MVWTFMGNARMYEALRDYGNRISQVGLFSFFYFLYIRDYSTCCLAKMYEQSDRNIRKVRATILRKIHKKLIPILQYKCDNGLSTTMKERNFLERHCSTDG